MLKEELTATPDEGRFDYPDSLAPVEDTSEYEVRTNKAGSLVLVSSREAAKTIAHRINIYSVTPDKAYVIEWRKQGNGPRVATYL